MKESYHICFTSHDEVMFRDQEDYGTILNLLALQCHSKDTELLVDAEMSTHVHLNVFSAAPVPYARSSRMSYTKYFNHKYGREGRFGEKYTFVLKVEGFYHQLTLQNYVLRNGLHHGAAATAFGYPHCTVRELFAQDIGMSAEKAVPMSRPEIASILPCHAEFPDEYRMNASGIFVRDSFMELRRAEQVYATPRNYLYQMNRLTDDRWIKDQLEDHTGSPLTLAEIEKADEKSVAQMLINESGRNFDRHRMQDPAVCALIDKNLIIPFGATSVYQLTDSQKTRIARQLCFEFHLPEHQIRRCLVTGPDIRAMLQKKSAW